jgi:hypothetical protein
MTATRRTLVVAAVSAVLLAGAAVMPALAHHSFAMYDLNQRKTLTGKLIRFILGGNHCQYVIEVLNADGTAVKDKDGKAVTWNVETGASSQLASQGITTTTFKAGTIVTLTFSPLKDGRNMGAQQAASVVHCGDTMPKGGCTATTGKTYPSR